MRTVTAKQLKEMLKHVDDNMEFKATNGMDQTSFNQTVSVSFPYNKVKESYDKSI